MLPPVDGCWVTALHKLASALTRVDHFYDSMGGLVGYQLKSIQLIIGASATSDDSAAAGDDSAASSSNPGVSDGAAARADGAAEVQYHVPPALDLAGEAGRRVGARAASHGILALPFMAEILPVGGESLWGCFLGGGRMLFGRSGC